MSAMSNIHIEVQEVLAEAGEYSEEFEKEVGAKCLREAALVASNTKVKVEQESTREEYMIAAREYIKTASFAKEWENAFYRREK